MLPRANIQGVKIGHMHAGNVNVTPVTFQKVVFYLNLLVSA